MQEMHREHYRQVASRRFSTVPCAVCGTEQDPEQMRVVPAPGKRIPEPYTKFLPNIEFQCKSHRQREAPPESDTDGERVNPQ